MYKILIKGVVVMVCLISGAVFAGVLTPEQAVKALDREAKVTGVKTAGTLCDINGLVATDSEGLMMSCKNKQWHYVQDNKQSTNRIVK